MKYEIDPGRDRLTFTTCLAIAAANWRRAMTPRTPMEPVCLMLYCALDVPPPWTLPASRFSDRAARCWVQFQP
jgi:hypothetical protein